MRTSTTASVLAALIALSLSACGDDDAVGDAGGDGGGPGLDGGTAARDGGGLERDGGGTTIDGGGTAMDGGAPDMDGGPVVVEPAAHEGFGSNATGGSESTDVYHVTNLDASGPGSLANGIRSNRTIVFDVGGTIHATRLDLVGISYLTIAGSTAPSPGITLDNRTASGGGGPGGDIVSFDGDRTHHCILEGIRTINAGNDGINVLDGAHDILITNCASYDNADGNIDIAGGDHVTVQYCLMGPSATGGPGPMLVTAENVTVHHNFFSPRAPSTPGERCPLVHCNYTPVGSPNADIVNNLIWKFGRDDGAGSGFGVDVAYDATANVVANYAYTVGTSPENGVTRNAYGEPAGVIHAEGNVSGNTGIDLDADSNHAAWTIPPEHVVTTESACDAARRVLANAGPRPLNAREEAMLADAAPLPGCP